LTTLTDVEVVGAFTWEEAREAARVEEEVQ
jgi:hypothetical protein